ncbi:MULTISPECIES: SDR family oxidoreductase [unclassified Bradyrhizobium]|uniref:SDR family oxidoreductase n=1 Tax=unclassified Bradyrhizobium TaxID=2631580 RepID=UPI0028ED486B|nr:MULTISPECIES: SDR family oxidoreductase [unclassified Bradyrhizobium]
MRVLLTGVTGLIGAELAKRLCLQGHTVVGLSRRDAHHLFSGPSEPFAHSYVDGYDRDAIRLLRGDVAEPSLGVSDDVYRQLAEQTDLIVHAAAITEFGQPPAAYERVNVGGTQQILRMATGGRKIPVLYVSTAYVCGFLRGKVSEDKLHLPQRFGNAYEKSKFLAESYVRAEALSGLPSIIVRPSIVVGASNDGHIREFKNIYPALKVLTSGKVTTIPGQPAATLDLVPWDYVCDIITGILAAPERSYGLTFHAVGRQPLTLQDFSDVIAEYPSLRIPRFVPPESFVLDALPPVEQRYYRRLVSVYESYFVRQLEFSYENTRQLMGGHRPPAVKPFLRKVLNHCMSVGFLNASEAAVAE